MLVSTFKKLVLSALAIATLASASYAGELRSLTIKNDFTPEPDLTGEYKIIVRNNYGMSKVILRNIRVGQVEDVFVGLPGDDFDVTVIEVDPLSNDVLGTISFDAYNGNGSSSVNFITEKVTIDWNVKQ